MLEHFGLDTYRPNVYFIGSPGRQGPYLEKYFEDLEEALE